jgi:hypothetical protein
MTLCDARAVPVSSTHDPALAPGYAEKISLNFFFTAGDTRWM